MEGFVIEGFITISRIGGLVPDKMYQLRVISVNSIGLGPPSQEIAGTTKEEGIVKD